MLPLWFSFGTKSPRGLRQPELVAPNWIIPINLANTLLEGEKDSARRLCHSTHPRDRALLSFIIGSESWQNIWPPGYQEEPLTSRWWLVGDGCPFFLLLRADFCPFSHRTPDFMSCPHRRLCYWGLWSVDRIGLCKPSNGIEKKKIAFLDLLALSGSRDPQSLPHKLEANERPPRMRLYSSLFPLF